MIVYFKKISQSNKSNLLEKHEFVVLDQNQFLRGILKHSFSEKTFHFLHINAFCFEKFPYKTL